MIYIVSASALIIVHSRSVKPHIKSAMEIIEAPAPVKATQFGL